MPNKQLTATVRLNTKQAEQKLKNIAKAIDIINNSVNRQSNTYSKVNTALRKTTSQTTKAKVETDKWATSAKKVNTNFKKTGGVLSGITRNLKTLVATYAGIMGARAVLNTSDIITSAENKLNYLNGGDAQQTQLSMDKIYGTAQRSRSNYGDMVANVSKSMTLASGAFQDNVDNAIRFQEIMSKAYTVGGASAAEQSSSMYQLIQALGSGVLQGDELRSVREGAPIAYKEIEKFAQGVFNSTESLKDMASQGMITSDIVVAAMMQAGDSIDEAFEKTDMTFAQAGNNIKNMAIKAFEPVLQKLNDALNSEVGQTMLQGIGQTFNLIAKGLMWVMNLFGKFFTWCADNWNWLKYIIMGAITVLLAYTAVMVATSILRIGLWIAEHWQMLLIIGTLIAMVGMIVWVANTAASGCEFVVKALALVGLAIILIGLITGSTVLIIIGIIVALAAVIISFLDWIVGAFYVGIAFIYNLWFGLVDGVIQMFASIIDPIAGIIEWFVNAWNGAFTNVGGAFANFCGQLLSGLIGLVKPFAKLLDKIFGWDTNSAISEAQKSMKSWGKAEGAVTYSIETPTIKRLKYSDAWDYGVKKGESWQASINDFGGNIQNKIKGLSDRFGTFGASNNDKFNSLLTDPKYQLDGNYDPSNVLDSIGRGVGDIGNDTGSIADSMELTQEDMEYLRRIADMEWKKEFTTANITVDMSNYNTINGDGDLDGIVTKLSDKLREEMNVLADGVYAY